MIEISKDFNGGNIEILSIDNNTYYVKPELRDTEGEWFYWAFKVSGAQGKTIKFVFNNSYVGYYGPAISYDCEHWKWQFEGGNHSGNSFSYTFSEEEKEVYFAHNYVYSPERFFNFAKKNNIDVNLLCVSEKGRNIPYVKFGNGENHIILTSRHHACESTGSYVLEGVLKALYKNPIPNTTVFCVPMVDYDGVMDGDQGKNRIPHDHNRDYYSGEQIYASTTKIKDYIDKNNVVLVLDFHSPWHISGINDKVFLVRSGLETENSDVFAKLLEKNITDNSLKYFAIDDMAANTGWNLDSAPALNKYATKKEYCKLALTVETCYFGEENNIFTDRKAIELGRCFAEAIRKFI